MKNNFSVYFWRADTDVAMLEKSQERYKKEGVGEKETDSDRRLLRQADHRILF